MVKVYNTMAWGDAKILVQLRTGYIGLNFSLERVGRSECKICACGLGTETTMHFLFLFPRWREQRIRLRNAMGDRWADLPHALGGWSDGGEVGKLIDRRKENRKPNIRH
jgi:hypothetical protein